ncbi:hypothetical protein Pint_35654 [Pistacia integerrima]|uniref:Uncharacterized protein n=1 Tax=Pistacia integerrima TaxID=434235 RepID=A0ACC0Y2U9_9ROSI|nr:hypothetical protein Pint_35654 [Pistacia integerrima]
MKVAVLVLLFVVVMMEISCCLAAPRRAALGGIYGQEQRHHAEKGKVVEAKAGKSKTIDNHHSIPRQNYNDKSGSPGDNGGDNSDDGTGFLVCDEQRLGVVSSGKDK